MAGGQLHARKGCLQVSSRSALRRGFFGGVGSGGKGSSSKGKEMEVPDARAADAGAGARSLPPAAATDAEGEVLRHARGCAAKRSGEEENARGEIGKEGEGEGQEMSQEEEGVAGVNKEEAGGGGCHAHLQV